MAEKKEDGGPVHPIRGSLHDACLREPPSTEPWRVSNGLTLRDYFAAKALPFLVKEAWGEEGGGESAAIGAYQIADLMLEARKK